MYPIFIPSKNRHDINGTARLLEKLGIPEIRFIVEKDQMPKYINSFGKDRVLELPHKYIENYDVLDEHGTKLPVGPGAQRNYAWDIAQEEGHEWHWVLDDNLIHAFFRYSQDGFQHINEGRPWFNELEASILQYNNVAMGGPNDWKFVVHRGQRVRRYTPNTRIYSFNLIRTALPVRWRGRYNEDTILSIDILKLGFATLLSNEHLMKKAKTNVVRGGNTQAFYHVGTGPKSRMMKVAYPEYTSVVRRFGRIHHYCNYRKHFLHIPLVIKGCSALPSLEAA